MSTVPHGVEVDGYEWWFGHILITLTAGNLEDSASYDWGGSDHPLASVVPFSCPPFGPKTDSVTGAGAVAVFSR